MIEGDELLEEERLIRRALGERRWDHRSRGGAHSLLKPRLSSAPQAPSNNWREHNDVRAGGEASLRLTNAKGSQAVARGGQGHAELR